MEQFYCVPKVKGVQRPTRVTVGASASEESIEVRVQDGVSREEVRQVLAVLAVFFESDARGTAGEEAQETHERPTPP
jgi:hypothetical protein